MKRLIKKLLYLSGYLFHHNRLSKMIYFHDVGLDYTSMGTPRDMIRQDLEEVMRRGFDLVDEIGNENNQVMVGFDDGWRGLYDNRDLFVDLGVFPTVFIAVDLIGKMGYMTVDEIKEMMSLGYHFQCHSWSHNSLPSFDGDALFHELKDSKEWLSRVFNTPFDDVCFPQGLFSKNVMQCCAAFGYRHCYSSLWGSFNQLDNRGVKCRILLQDISPSDVKYIVEGDIPLLRNKLYKQHYKN